MNANSSSSSRIKLGGTHTRLWRELWIIQEKGEDTIRNACEELLVLILIPKVWNMSNTNGKQHLNQPYSFLPHILHLAGNLLNVACIFFVIQAESSWNCFPNGVQHCDEACGEAFKHPSVWHQYAHGVASSHDFSPSSTTQQTGDIFQRGCCRINQSLIVKNIHCVLLCVWLSTGLVYVRQHLNQMTEAAVEQVGHYSSDENDLFSSMKFRRSQGTGELIGYLACVLNQMDLLNSFSL